MPNGVTWHGTEEEARALMHAVANNCACAERNAADFPGPRRCGPHELVASQRALDRLLFARRIRDRVMAEELSTERAEALGR